MIEHLRNMVRAEVERVLARRARRIPVLVDSYDPDRHAVKVKMQPEGTISGWVDIESLQVGSGFGVMVAPNIGDPGWLEFHEDDFNAGVFVGSSFNDRFKPVAVKAGEMLFKHKSGALLFLHDDGSIEVKDKAGASVKLDGASLVTVADKAGSTLVLDGAGNATVTAISQAAIHAPTIVLQGAIQLAGNVTGAGGGTVEVTANIDLTGALGVSGGVTAGGNVIGAGHNLSTHIHHAPNGNTGPAIG